jgi:hypothetical protein
MRIALTLDRDAPAREENDYISALMAVGFAREEIVLVPPEPARTGTSTGSSSAAAATSILVGTASNRARDARLELDTDRDDTDFALFEAAQRNGTPTLAICGVSRSPTSLSEAR